ncbi:MAG TPA: plasmid mobilization relaxosome protein MobC, partial [Parabacteroides sp.]|nr:plasmid mobilization relaxosome protein MobC [Parabacteroides sp.]
INSTGRFYQDDIDELKEKMDAVWQLLKSKQSEEL